MNKAVIPVAGLGTRLLPATKSQPKEMLPVGRKPIVQYIVEELIRIGIEEILFITGPGKTSIENHFGVNYELVQTLREKGKEELLAELEFDRVPAQYYYTHQRQLLGLGHAVLCSRSFADDEPFVVALGDSIIGLNAQSDIVRRMQRCFVEKGCVAVIAFEQVSNEKVHQYGIAQPKSNGEFFELSDIVEKPTLQEAPSNLAVAARYVFSPKIFAALDRTEPGKGGEIQLTDAIRLLIKEGGKVWGVQLGVNERRHDIGNFGSYFRAFTEFALADEKYGESLREYIATLNKG
ncbi:MAG: UTP--glucose-1-phosphate uridylyltransferase [Deltaproteobacteria bacterium]|nr:UTP--glucose-1-phosphate uridylyltransferase [Deltaproteobacteria bacterium]